jgi:archaellum component FlaC
MAGIREEQADQIIDLLKEILEELGRIRNESMSEAILDESREMNVTLNGISTTIGSIERDVSSIEGKD